MDVRITVTIVTLAIGLRLFAQPVYAQVSSAATKDRIQLLTLGTFHGEEADAENGEEWWALMRTPEGHVVRSAKIAVNVVNDPIVDNEDESTGKEITLKDSVPEEECLFLVRGLSGIRERTTPVLFEGYLFLSPGQTVRFGSYERGISFRAESNADSNGTVSYELVASSWQTGQDGDSETREQTVFALSGMHEGPPFDGSCGVIEWIGDLDGDGHWDFLANLSDHYNVSQPTLFLSTQRKANEVAGKSAEFRTTGC